MPLFIASQHEQTVAFWVQSLWRHPFLYISRLKYHSWYPHCSVCKWTRFCGYKLSELFLLKQENLCHIPELRQVCGYMYGCVEPFVLSRSPYGMHFPPHLFILFIVTDHERVLDLMTGCAKMTLMIVISWLFGRSVLHVEVLHGPTARDLDFFNPLDAEFSLKF